MMMLSGFNAMQAYGSGIGGGANANTFNPFSFLSNIHMGRSSLVNANWNLPQTIVMGLTGSLLPYSAADFIIVTVIPYTSASTMLSLPLPLQLHRQLHYVQKIILGQSAQ